jgi:hypothetical protein
VYCSLAHQRLHWKKQHKVECHPKSQPKSTNIIASATTPTIAVKTTAATVDSNTTTANATTTVSTSTTESSTYWRLSWKEREDALDVLLKPAEDDGGCSMLMATLYHERDLDIFEAMLVPRTGMGTLDSITPENLKLLAANLNNPKNQLEEGSSFTELFRRLDWPEREENNRRELAPRCKGTTFSNKINWVVAAMSELPSITSDFWGQHRTARERQIVDADLLIASGDVSQAAQAYLQLHRSGSHPRDASLLLKLCDAYLTLQNFPKARESALCALAMLDLPVRRWSDSSSAYSPKDNPDAVLAAKAFDRLAKSYAVQRSEYCPITARRAAFFSSRCLRSTTYQKMCSKLEERHESTPKQSPFLRRTNDMSFERHPVGNTVPLAVLQGTQLRRLALQSEDVRLGFFASGDVRNLLFSLDELFMTRCRLAADSELKDGVDGAPSPLAVEVVLNDGTMSVLARDIILLLIASEHRVTGTKTVDLETTLLFIAVHAHLVLFGNQRRYLDSLILGLIQFSTSLEEFQDAYSWLQIKGETPEATLRELRWIWIRWSRCKRVTLEELERVRGRLQGNQQIFGVDPESGAYYAKHGMLPLSPELRALLPREGGEWLLEDDEREGQFRYVNPTLVCPYVGSISDETGPFPSYQDHFKERRKDASLTFAPTSNDPNDRDSDAPTRASDGGALNTFVHR